MQLYENKNYAIAIGQNGDGEVGYLVINKITGVDEEFQKVMTHAINCADIYSQALDSAIKASDGKFVELFDELNFKELDVESNPTIH